MWKNKLLEMVKDFQHPAWGFNHFTRVFELSFELAQAEGIDLDEDAIFAAAYLHDIGAFEPYKQKGKDHSVVAIENCDAILASINYPSVKISLVKDIIKSHMFYVKPENNIESKIFHDADTLDFMGAMGISRILSIVGIDDWTPDLKSAVKLIEKFSNELVHSLVTKKGKEIGLIRKEEMEDFLKKLKNQTNQFKSL
ncbi:MAG: HD domain-containing protein [Candidatus Hermodarchaeota archaeon]